MMHLMIDEIQEAWRRAKPSLHCCKMQLGGVMENGFGVAAINRLIALGWNSGAALSTQH
jgi:hypothetical protein